MAMQDERFKATVKIKISKKDGSPFCDTKIKYHDMGYASMHYSLQRNLSEALLKEGDMPDAPAQPEPKATAVHPKKRR